MQFSPIALTRVSESIVYLIDRHGSQMRIYKHEGFRRLGIVLGCVGSITWAVLFTWKSWHSWSNIVETRYEEYVSGSKPVDLVAKRLDAKAAQVSAKDRWTFKFNPAALISVMLADSDFRKLTRSDQVAVFEYLTGKYAAARKLSDLMDDDEKAERVLEKRLGPRPLSEVRHDPNDPDPSMRSDVFDRHFSRDPAASHVDTTTRRHWLLQPTQLFTMAGGLLLGCVVAFAALWSLVASVDWVIEGFRKPKNHNRPIF